MGFSLYNLFKAGLLMANAITVLNPKRFLKQRECNVLKRILSGNPFLPSPSPHFRRRLY